MVLTRKYTKSKGGCLKIDSGSENSKRCYFCGGNHLCRECPQETMLAPILKKYIGKIMEDFIGNNFCCPNCQTKNLSVLGNHTPSLDIICSNCHRKYEVKSKCLSVNNLPRDLKMPHGSYDDYKRRQKSGLDLFVIIYKVDRVNKKITIRELRYARNKQIVKNDNIRVVKRSNSHLSTIIINNKNLLTKIELGQVFQFDFSSIIKKYMETSNFIDNMKNLKISDCNSYEI